LRLLRGAGAELTVDKEQVLLKTNSDQIAFSGSAETSSVLLDGPIVDFNVIFRPEAHVSVHQWRVSPTLSRFLLPDVAPARADAAPMQQFDFLYCYDDDLVYQLDGEDAHVPAKALLQRTRSGPDISCRCPTGFANVLVVSLLYFLQ
jgi:hypothetical protein